MSKIRLLLITLLALATAFGLHALVTFIKWARPLTVAIVVPGGQVTAAERALRPIYPYSVIPGGAYTPEELRQSAEKDTVVRGHYKDFDLRSARLVTLLSDRYQYASFRIRNNVYWTRKKIRIPKGEVLLTDGAHFARTRCGNRLCDTLQTQKTFQLPSYKPLTLPAFTPQLLSKGVTLPPAPVIAELVNGPGLDFELPRLAPYVPPVAPLPGNTVENWPPVNVAPPPMAVLPGFPSPLPVHTNIPVFSPTAPVTVAEVPEPASIYLLLAAFLLSGWVFTRWLRHHSHASFESSPAESTEDEN